MFSPDTFTGKQLSPVACQYHGKKSLKSHQCLTPYTASFWNYVLTQKLLICLLQHFHYRDDHPDPQLPAALHLPRKHIIFWIIHHCSIATTTTNEACTESKFHWPFRTPSGSEDRLLHVAVNTWSCSCVQSCNDAWFPSHSPSSPFYKVKGGISHGGG